MATNVVGGLSVDGSPVLPFTTGNVFYVKASGGSDGNDGRSTARAFATLDYAIGRTTANQGDVIIMLPGAHSYAASVLADVAGIKITGLPGGNFVRPRASIVTTADDEVINVTAADVEIAYLRIIPVTTKAGIDFTAGADRLYVHDCSFDLATAAADTGTKGVATTTNTIAADHTWIEHNYFECDGAQGSGVDVGAGIEFVVEKNTFVCRAAGAWNHAVSCAGPGGFGTIRDNDFQVYQGGSMTIGIRGSDMTSVGSVGVYRNMFAFGVTVPIDDFAAGEAFISENYKANSGAASGGVLWSSIT